MGFKLLLPPQSNPTRGWEAWLREALVELGVMVADDVASLEREVSDAAYVTLLVGVLGRPAKVCWLQAPAAAP